MFGFLKSLDENQLLRLRKPDSFTARDIADFAFLYLITLHIMRSEYESAPFAQRYAEQTNRHGGYTSSDPTNTDLYQFLNILTDHNGKLASRLDNPEANSLLWPMLTLSQATVRQLLSEMARRGPYDGNNARRLLLKLEQQLYITTSNYKSMRRLAGEWMSDDIDTHQKQLVITRMLQALRTRARQSDLLPQLERLASHGNYELNAHMNAETGQKIKGAGGESEAVKWAKTLALMGGLYAADHVLKNWRLGKK
jgi:hypothetical protein